jgi:hypothetical protein
MPFLYPQGYSLYDFSKTGKDFMDTLYIFLSSLPGFPQRGNPLVHVNFLCNVVCLFLYRSLDHRLAGDIFLT